jgi:hypothetical protein
MQLDVFVVAFVLFFLMTFAPLISFISFNLIWKIYPMFWKKNNKISESIYQLQRLGTSYLISIIAFAISLFIFVIIVNRIS